MIARLDRFNRRHPWSHNDRFARWVARQVVGSGARAVLDVGCGTGNLVDRLRRHMAVTGLEPDPDTGDAARRRFADDPGVTVHRHGFAERDRARRWDAVVMVAALHHLPLTPTLRELRATLAPGGRLVVVGCYREASLVDVLFGLVSTVVNPVVGLIAHPATAREVPRHMTAPTAPARETLADIRDAARRELPGARIRRRLFWRYTLVHDAPR